MNCYELIRGIWSGRRDRYSELRASMRDAADLHKVEMNYIGGWTGTAVLNRHFGHAPNRSTH